MPASKKKSPLKKKATAKRGSTGASSKRKTTSKAKTTKTTPSSSSPVGKTADSVLKLVDEAAELLRKGIREGASQTERARLATKRQALTLVSKASSQLSKLISKI